VAKDCKILKFYRNPEAESKRRAEAAERKAAWEARQVEKETQKAEWEAKQAERRARQAKRRQETKAAGAEIVGISGRAEVAVITVVLESLMLACLAVSVILVSVVG